MAKKKRRPVVQAQTTKDSPVENVSREVHLEDMGKSARETRSWKYITLACVAGLLSAMAVQMFIMSRDKSATMDEQNHITRGLVYLRTGDLRLGRLHPPLINIISALPLALDKSLTLPLDDPSWQAANLDAFADQLIWQRKLDSHSIIFRARLPVVALTILLGLLLFSWSRELFGGAAGVLTLALFSFDPNFLAQGSLATNDLGVACFSTLALYTFWRWLKVPSWQRGIVAAISFGLAQLSKFSALFLIPSLALVLLAFWLTTPRDLRPKVNLLKLALVLVAVCLGGAVVIWAFYGFKIGEAKAFGITLPAPAYLDEIRAMLRRVKEGNQTFLLGSYSASGWWYYFPVVFAVKTPIPTLLLSAASLVFAWRTGTWKTLLVLLVPIAVFFGLAVMSPLNLGYRHLLPAVVLLFVIAGNLAAPMVRLTSKLAWIGMVLCAWLVIENLFAFPNHLAYFNEFAGGSANGFKVLVDSNLDWGQDLIGLRRYMKAQAIDQVKLSYFGSADPVAYGIKFEPLPGYPRFIWRHDNFPPFLLEPEAGVYAISATNLQGEVFKNHNMYAWFKQRTPDTVIGHSIFIYRVQR